MKLGLISSEQFAISFKRLMANKLPIPTMFKLRGLVKKINEEAIKYDEMVNELLCRYAEKDEKGNPIKATIENGKKVTKLDLTKIEEYAKERMQLDSIEVEIPTIKLSELGTQQDLEKLNILGEDILTLEFIVEE